MMINSAGISKILKILAEQYFDENDWKYFSVEADFGKVEKFAEDVNRQYLAYQNISRDWYVQNAGVNATHFCKSWDELKTVVDILKSYGKFFDYYVDTGEFRAFCVVSPSKDLGTEQIAAILEAEKASVKTIVFISPIAGTVETSVLQIKKGE